jgi:hypothetical protein
MTRSCARVEQVRGEETVQNGGQKPKTKNQKLKGRSEEMKQRKHHVRAGGGPTLLLLHCRLYSRD